jgi:hypothetical protein
MCIDKLEIAFEQSSGDLGRPIGGGVDSTIVINGTDPSLVDLSGVLTSLVFNGYSLVEGSGRRRGHNYYYNHEIHHQGEALGITLLCRGRNPDERYIFLISCNPSRLPHWQDFWRVIEAMDGHIEHGIRYANRVIERGYVQRIDYACDYRVEIDKVMQGLHVDHSQTLVGYNDAFDNPYAEYRWDRSMFFSFRIGAGDKVLKIYDKRLEQARRRNNRLTEPANIDDTLNEWGETDIETYNDETPPPSLTDLPPKTRLEQSVSTRSKVRDFWNRRYLYSDITRTSVRADGTYQGRLNELPDHIQDIISSRHEPFMGVILHYVSFRGSHYNKTHEWLRVKHDIEAGLFMNVYKRLQAASNGEFWREHQNYFALYPWNPSYQPTHAFRMRLWAWMTESMVLDERGYPVTDKCYSKQRRSTARWDIQSTQGSVRRRATQTRPHNASS